MSIKWFENGVLLEETHVGLVIGDPVTRTKRVMSDIYCDVTAVHIWNPTEKRVDRIDIDYHGWECVPKTGVHTPDIQDGAFADEYQKYQEKEKELALEMQKRQAKALVERKELEAKESLLLPAKGVKCKVVKGRKVPRGTIGEIFWIGDKGYGVKVGLKDAKGQSHFTSVSNIICTAFGLDFGQDPVGMSWRDLKSKVYVAEQDAHNASKLPISGEVVREKKNPANKGRIFWVKEKRIGFKKNRNADPNWANMNEVEYYDSSSSTWKDYVLVAPVFPDFSKPAEKVPSTAAPAVNPFASFPPPLCDIRQISQREDGKWVALDGEGVLITVLPESSALELGALLV